MRRERRRFLVEWILMFLLLPSAMVWLDGRPGLSEANTAIYDRILLGNAPQPSPEILIIGIDKRTLDALGPWPLSRATHAQLLDALAPHAPRGVLFDVFFDRPADDPAQDQALAAAMSRVRVFLPLNYVPPPAAQPKTPPSFTPPIPALAVRAAGIGHVNATPDSDGLVRSIWRYEGSGAHKWPYLGLVAAGDHASGPAGGAEGWGRQGRFGLAFAGPAGTYPTVSYLDALRGGLTDDTVRGKLILIGALSDSGLGDTLPVAGIGALTALPGIEIHANALDSLMTGRAIDMPMDWRRVLWISVPVWTVLLLYLVVAAQAVTSTLILAALCVVGDYLALTYARIDFPLASPLCGIALAYLLWSWRRLNALLVFFRHRADALNAVPAGAFEPPLQTLPQPLDSVDRRMHALDRAIDRLTRLQSLLTEGMWQLPVPVLICRADGVVSQSNAAAQALLGPVRATSVLRGLGDGADLLHGVDLPRRLAELQRVDIAKPAARGAAGLWDSAMSSEFTTDQGHVFRLRAASLGDATQAAGSAWVVVLADMTTERRVQRERAQWFGFLSHDLRGPQVTILSLLGLYSERAPNVGIQDVIDGIGAEARRTIHLAESFMDMVEAESGVYRYAVVFAGSAVLDAVDATWAAAHARGLTITPRLGAEDCMISADASLLTRALVNLLNNAIRYSESGSTIHVCLDANGTPGEAHGEVLISIRDEGAGMNAAQVAGLLDTGLRRKWNATPAAHDTGHGWGIGMTIVHAVVAHHGGWIDVMSAPGAGTTFLVGLPMATEEAPEESERD